MASFTLSQKREREIEPVSKIAQKRGKTGWSRDQLLDRWVDHCTVFGKAQGAGAWYREYSDDVLDAVLKYGRFEKVVSGIAIPVTDPDERLAMLMDLVTTWKEKEDGSGIVFPLSTMCTLMGGIARDDPGSISFFSFLPQEIKHKILAEAFPGGFPVVNEEEVSRDWRSIKRGLKWQAYTAKYGEAAANFLLNILTPGQSILKLASGGLVPPYYGFTRSSDGTTWIVSQLGSQPEDEQRAYFADMVASLFGLQSSATEDIGEGGYTREVALPFEQAKELVILLLANDYKPPRVVQSLF